MAATGVAAVWLTGCTSHTQTQYFAVKDPNTGAANYYRLTIHGCGSLSKYNLQAGYYSAAAVDILRGRMPDVPELDLPIERGKTYASLLQHIDKALLQEAEQIAPITDPAVVLDEWRKRSDQARSEQTRLQAEQAKAQENLTVTSNKVEQAATGLDHAKARLATATAAMHEATNALAEAKAGTNEAAIAKAEDLLADRRKQSESAADGLAEANTDLAAAKRSRASVENRLSDLRSSIQSAGEAKSQAAGAISQLTARYPNSALGLDQPDISTNSLSAGLSDPDAFRSKYIKLARLVWLSSLSGADVTAVGMNQTLDPFQFRKLVFWTKSTTLNLDQSAGDVDTILGQVVEIGRNYKNIAQEREAARAQAQADQTARANAAMDTLKTLSKGDVDMTVLTNIVKMLVPDMSRPAKNQP